MPTLALAVIALDEERGLPLTVASVADLVDEVVVAVDSRTTDRSREVVAAARVFDVEFADFAQMRNAALERVTADWILMLDADEVLTGDPRPLMDEPPAIWELPRHHWRDLARTLPAADERFFPDRQGRLFPNDPRVRFERPVHEYPSGLRRRRTAEVVIHHLKEALRSPATLAERRRVYEELVARGRAAGYRFRTGRDA
ncbi:MAG: glycosyltransferase [Planctomycetota bacterium]|jgi:glycosyltransferase involved in cell wall biosynthesis